MFEQSGWVDMAQDFALLYLICYGAHLAVYFGVGSFVQYLCSRRPDYKIQSREVRDRTWLDIRQSVLSLSAISFYLAAGLALQHMGWTLFKPLELSIWSVLLMGIVSLLLYDAWFYWFHRLAHWKPMFRFHALHHRSIVPNTWSNNNDTLVGAFLEQSYFMFVVLVFPIPPAVLIAHRLYDQVTGMFSHSGYEFFASPSARKPWPGLCVIFHDQHHSNFRCNYGNTFSFWDRFMGTLHPRYDTTVETFEHKGDSKAVTTS